MNGHKVMDHAEYPQRVKTMTTEALLYTIKDAKDALAAYPENPNAGYYQDEICYCSQELHERRKRGVSNEKAWQMRLVSQAEMILERLMHEVVGYDEPAARARLLEALANENVQQVIVQAVSEVALP